MMRSEFIERTGFDPTADEYAEIELQYMDSDLDKDKFCAKWKRDGGVIRYANQRRYVMEELVQKLNKSDHELELMTSSRDYQKKLADEYRSEVFHLKQVIQELERDRDTYRNKLQAIKDALNYGSE